MSLTPSIPRDPLTVVSLLNGDFPPAWGLGLNFQILGILDLKNRCYMISTAFSSLKGLIVSVKSVK